MADQRRTTEISDAGANYLAWVMGHAAPCNYMQLGGDVELLLLTSEGYTSEPYHEWALSGSGKGFQLALDDCRRADERAKRYE